MRFLFPTLCIVFSILLVGCANGEPAAEKPAKSTELFISAAASLTDALEELKSTYEERHEGVKLTYNFGSSGKLATTIENGAPSDVFLSASTKDMNDLEDKGLIVQDSRVDFASNALVLIANKVSDSTIDSFEQIDPSTISHFAIGDPETVPVGRYTKEAFENLALWDVLQDKFVRGSDVRQVLTHVEMGNADYGVVYSSDAFVSDKVQVLAEANTDWHAPIVYPGAVLQDSRHPEAAQQFLDYLTSAEGKEVLQKFGFN